MQSGNEIGKDLLSKKAFLLGRGVALWQSVFRKNELKLPLQDPRLNMVTIAFVEMINIPSSENLCDCSTAPPPTNTVVKLYYSRFLQIEHHNAQPSRITADQWVTLIACKVCTHIQNLNLQYDMVYIQKWLQCYIKVIKLLLLHNFPDTHT